MARANYTPDALLLLTNIQYNLTISLKKASRMPGLSLPNFGVGLFSDYIS
jgi:hypothetical protein